MPVIQVNMLAGRPIEAKRKFATNLTKLVCDDLGVRPEQVRIIFNEMQHENYSIAGTLVADKEK